MYANPESESVEDDSEGTIELDFDREYSNEEFELEIVEETEDCIGIRVYNPDGQIVAEQEFWFAEFLLYSDDESGYKFRDTFTSPTSEVLLQLTPTVDSVLIVVASPFGIETYHRVAYDEVSVTPEDLEYLYSNEVQSER